MNRIEQYLKYHYDSSIALDIDPQNEAILYLCDRFELNIEQRLWLCFLFATNYSVPTTYFIYNEFPDYQTVDVGRLQQWWDANREKLIFQTDRAWVRSRNQFVDVFKSYRDCIRKWSNGSNLQYEAITNMLSNGNTPEESYQNLLTRFGVFQFGRFAMFLYSELLHNVANIPIKVKLNINEAESSRNGLVFALGLDTLYSGRSGKTLPKNDLKLLNNGLMHIANKIAEMPIKQQHKSLWSIETTLCAFKKHILGKRYVGYYIERMRNEINKLESKTNRRAGGGVSWLPLWQFRVETYNPKFLLELR